MLVGVKGLSLCSCPGPLGSEVWHPICKQAARAEKKLKVSQLVVLPAQLLFCHRLGALCFSGDSFHSVHTLKCEPWISLMVTPSEIMLRVRALSKLYIQQCMNGSVQVLLGQAIP